MSHRMILRRPDVRAACRWLAAVGAVAFAVAFVVTLGSAARSVPPRAVPLSAPPGEPSTSVPERRARLRAVADLPAVLRSPPPTPTPAARTLVVAPVIAPSDNSPPTAPAPTPSQPAPSPPAPPPAATPAPDRGPTFDSSG